MSKPKSVRLSEFLRDSILSSVMLEFTANFLKPHGLQTVADLKEAIKEEGRSVATKLWDRCYGHLPFGKVPVWALSQTNQFTVAQEDDTSNTFACYVHWGAAKINSERRPCKSAIDLLVSKEEWASLLEHRESLEGLKEVYDNEYNALRSEIKPVLDSFSTTRQLLDTWPSMEKFLPANIADPDKGVNLPALSLSRLESKINGEV